MTEHEMVKGINSGPIAKIMLAEMLRMLFGGAVILGVFALGFWMGSGMR